MICRYGACLNNVSSGDGKNFCHEHHVRSSGPSKESRQRAKEMKEYEIYGHRGMVFGDCVDEVL